MIKQIALATAALTALAAPAAQAEDREIPRGEARLAELLEGRTAGEPANCIDTFGSRPLTVIDDTAIVYRDGDTIWVNRTASPRSLDKSDVMVIRKFIASRLCRSDFITTVDSMHGFYTGNVILTDFIPYTKRG